MSEHDGWLPLEQSPRRRLADALRPLIAMTVASVADDEALNEAADAVEAATESLAGKVAPGRRSMTSSAVADLRQGFFSSSPIVGTNNPIAPPVRLRVINGTDGRYSEIVAEANFGYPYEGPPTCVHGGVIAETFDEVMGAANVVAGNPGMTGTLTIRYRRPTPLGADLHIEARCLGRSGRKIRTWAGIFYQGQLTAEADGIFIEVGPSHLLGIAEDNPDQIDQQSLALLRNEAANQAAVAGTGGISTE